MESLKQSSIKSSRLRKTRSSILSAGVRKCPELLARHGWLEMSARLIHPVHTVAGLGRRRGLPLPVTSCGGGAAFYQLRALANGGCRYGPPPPPPAAGLPQAALDAVWAETHAAFHECLASSR